MVIDKVFFFQILACPLPLFSRLWEWLWHLKEPWPSAPTTNLLNVRGETALLNVDQFCILRAYRIAWWVTWSCMLRNSPFFFLLVNIESTSQQVGFFWRLDWDLPLGFRSTKMEPSSPDVASLWLAHIISLARELGLWASLVLLEACSIRIWIVARPYVNLHIHC